MKVRVVDDEGQPVQATLSHMKKEQQYKVTFQPQKGGMHTVSAFFGDIEITGKS